MKTITFVVPGNPVPKGRPRFARRGAFVTTYTDDRTASYENLVKVIAQRAMSGQEKFVEAVAVSISLLVTPPQSWSKKKQQLALSGDIFPTTKPDVDNVTKGIFDALNEIVWNDDKQVCDVHVTKRYSSTAGASIEIRTLTGVQ